MATRSYIGTLNKNQTVTSIYCHWDGYPEGVGKTLLNHYSDPDKVRQLVKLGSLSVLGKEIGEKQNFDSYEGGNEICLAYGRDRGETNVEAINYPTKEDFLSQCEEDYTYLFEDGQWLCRDWDGPLVDLKSVSSRLNIYAPR